MTTFYLVFSAEGLEGSFTTEADADAYRRELRTIGIARLRIERKEVAEPLTDEQRVQFATNPAVMQHGPRIVIRDTDV